MAPPYDVLVLGSGAAGLTTVLRLLELAPHLSIAVVTKETAFGGSTALAQGGIAAVLDSRDSLESHIADTEVAGAGLCHPETVRFVVERAPGAIAWLAEQGVPFDRNQGVGGYDLTLEGGHTHRRIVHATDSTGRAVSRSLVERLRGKSVAWLEQAIAIDLMVEGSVEADRRYCRGATLLHAATGQTELVLAHMTVLATGGASGAYLHATNPNNATGDGIAMAWRAGCRVAGLEFNQFHPTCLYQENGSSFLISEALRGEGGRLRQLDGSPFMQHYDPRGELAPRDIVARAILDVMTRRNEPHVLLDVSHLPADFLLRRFPTIAAQCRSVGVDLTSTPIPVVPVAHYTCGGVATDLKGRTDIDHLYAIGETAWTGLHGANRLASNSLLECVVFGLTAAADIAANRGACDANFVRALAAADAQLPDVQMHADADSIATWRHELRSCLWDNVGIVRSPESLRRAEDQVKRLQGKVETMFLEGHARRDIVELRNLTDVACLIVQSARRRRESRGTHFMTVDSTSIAGVDGAVPIDS